jgi:hypothetical protein
MGLAAAVWMLLALGGCGTESKVEPGDTTAETVPDARGDVSPEQDAPAPQAAYTVHEWGVIASGRVQTAPTTFVSMEDKPVLYFYSDEEIAVDASVEIKGGTARESWPEVTLGATLSWPGLTVEAGPCAAPTPFPASGKGQCPEPYEEPCEATMLGDYVVPDASCLRFGDVTSPLLFYAGALDQPWLPVSGQFMPARDRTKDAVQVTLTLAAAFARDLLVVYRDIEAQGGGYMSYNTTAAHMGVNAALLADRVGDVVGTEVAWDEVVDDPDKPGFGPAPQLETAVAALRLTLAGMGLTDDEVEAFVAAWSGIFFGVDPQDGQPGVAPGESLCVIGFHDEPVYDTLLPLTLVPPPSERVRVLVSYTCL